MKSFILFHLLFLNIACFSQIDSIHPDSKTNSDNKPFNMVEIMPEYTGGERAMYKFIQENINYPSKAIRNGIEGTVVLKFIIDTIGQINRIEVLNKNKLGYGCEEEALRVIRLMPKWKPGMQNNVAVPVYFSLPIRFKLR